MAEMNAKVGGIKMDEMKLVSDMESMLFELNALKGMYKRCRDNNVELKLENENLRSTVHDLQYAIKEIKSSVGAIQSLIQTSHEDSSFANHLAETTYKYIESICDLLA